MEGKGHFHFAILIDRLRLLHEENLLSSRILLDQIVTKDLFDERFHRAMTDLHRMVRGDLHEHRSTLRWVERKSETFVLSVLVNDGEEITCRSSSARKMNSG